LLWFGTLGAGVPGEAVEESQVPAALPILIGQRTSAVLVGRGVQVISNIHVNYVEPLAAAS